MKIIQKKYKYSDTGLVCAIKSPNTNKKSIRIGRSNKFNQRLSGYNTTMPDNFDILYTLEVSNPIAVEKCIQGVLYNYQYRSNKDYYDIPIKKIKYVFNICKNIIDSFYCHTCNRRFGNDSLIKHSTKHDKMDVDNILVNINRGQLKDNLYRSYSECDDIDNFDNCNDNSY